MNTKLVRIGNSQGVRIPKLLLEEAGLDGEVRLSVTEGGILIESMAETRADWADAAALLHDRGESTLLDAPQATDWDESEWVWR